MDLKSKDHVKPFHQFYKTLPKGWSLEKLSDVVITKGRIGWKGLKNSEYVDSGPYIVTGVDIVDDEVYWSQSSKVTEERYLESPEIMLKENDILMTKDGTIGKLAYIQNLSNKATVAGHIHVIRVKTSDLLPRFLYFFFKTKNFTNLIKSRIQGSVIPSITQRDIMDLEILVPPLNEQKFIISQLDSIDKKLKVLNKQNKILEKIIQSIFNSWFIDFDGQSEFVSSELGEIPKGWKIGKISDLTDITSGKRPSEINEYQNEEFNVPSYGASGLKGFVKKPLFTESILITGRVGTLGIINRIMVPSFPSDNTLVIKPKENFYFEYLYFIMKEIDFESFNRGTSQPLVTQTDLNDLEIKIPSQLSLQKFHEIVKQIFLKMDLNDNMMNKLLHMFNSLLPKLMSGEIRV